LLYPILSLLSGDRGSGYAIAHRALRLGLRDYEHNHEDGEAYSNGTVNGNSDSSTRAMELFDLEESASTTALLKLFLNHLNMVAIYELVNWSLVASKHEIADLARIVIRAAQCGNIVARTAIEEATNEIAEDIICLLNKVSIRDCSTH